MQIQEKENSQLQENKIKNIYRTCDKKIGELFDKSNQ